MSAVVRHWPQGYQHDHKAKTVAGALRECMRCSGITLGETPARTLAAKLVREGSIKISGPVDRVFRIVQGS